jgi:tetratricopeptide (TPR) repeat protein
VTICRNLLFLPISLIASSLLLACTSLSESKHQDHPVAQGQAKGPVIDFIHPVDAPRLEEVKPRDTIEYQLKKHGIYLDLHKLENYSAKVTKNDLLPFRTNDGRFVRHINLGGLGLTDVDIEPISELKLTQLELDYNGLKDLHALKRMTSLTELKLMGNPINSEGMRVIATLPNLMDLELQRTPISESDVVNLYVLKNLSSLGLGACPHLTQSSIEHIEAKLPKCEIRFGTATRNKYKNELDVLKNIRNKLMRQSEFDEADSALVRLLVHWERQPNPPYELIVQGYRARADCQQGMKHPRAQLEMLMKCVTLYCQYFPDNIEIPKLEYDCGQLLDTLGEGKAALAMYEKADVLWKQHPPDEEIRGQFDGNLRRIGYHLESQGQYQRAKVFFESALKSAKEFFPEDSEEVTESKKGIAQCDYMTGDFKSAVQLLKEVLHTCEEKRDQDAQNDANRILAECYLRQGNYQEAEVLLMNRLKLSISDERRAQTYEALVQSLQAQKKQKEADHYRKMLNRFPAKKHSG